MLVLFYLFCFAFNCFAFQCEIIVARGFKCQKYNVTTYQGYIVEIHRVVNPKVGVTQSRPVLLQTGLIGTSADFVMASNDVTFDVNITGHNMGIELSKLGYDVWLSNNRGNEYGLNHVTMKPEGNRWLVCIERCVHSPERQC